MVNVLKQLFSLILLIGIIAVGYWFFNEYRKSQGTTPAGLTTFSDGTATFIGTVSKNNTGCQNGTASQCAFFATAGQGSVTIIYDTDDSSFCGNNKAASDGLNAGPGIGVRVNGAYRKTGDTYTINTCGSPDYFIVVTR